MSARTKTIIAGIWMLIFGLLALGTIQTNWNVSPFYVGIPHILIGFGMAVLSIVFEVKTLKVSGTMQETTSPTWISPYARAWNNIFRWKWLFQLAAAIGLLNGFSSIPELAVQYHYIIRDVPAKLLRHGGLSNILKDLGGLMLPLSSSVHRSITGLFPSIGLSGSVLVLVTIIALLPWLSRMLHEIKTEPEYADQARFVSKLLVPVGLITLLVAVLHVYKTWLMHQFGVSPGSGPYPTITTLLLTILSSLAALALYSGFVYPLMIGGLAGSFRRVQEREPISGRTFVEDAVAGFRLLAKIYLLLGFINFIIGLPSLIFMYTHPVFTGQLRLSYLQVIPLLTSLLYVLLIFTPYETSCKKSVGQAIAGSISIIRRHTLVAVAFIVFGMCLIAPVLLIRYVLDIFPIGMLRIYFLPLFGGILSAFISIFLAVAVWEFYMQIRAAYVADEG